MSTESGGAQQHNAQGDWATEARRLGWKAPEEHSEGIDKAVGKVIARERGRQDELLGRLENLERAVKAKPTAPDGGKPPDEGDLTERLRRLEAQAGEHTKKAAEREQTITALRLQLFEGAILEEAIRQGFRDPTDAVAHLRGRYTPDGKWLDDKGEVALVGGEEMTTAQAVARLAQQKRHLVDSGVRPGTGSTGGERPGPQGDKPLAEQIAEAEAAKDYGLALRLKMQLTEERLKK